MCLTNRSTAMALRVMYRVTPPLFACGHYLAVAVSLPPHFLLGANTLQYVHT
jgi:hypothetical protein